MERPLHLIRDYGLTLGLVVASVMLFWKTLLPQIQRNRELDDAYLEAAGQRREAERELERLKAMEEADWDPLLVERMAREVFHDLGFSPEETLVLLNE